MTAAPAVVGVLEKVIVLLTESIATIVSPVPRTPAPPV